MGEMSPIRNTSSRPELGKRKSGPRGLYGPCFSGVVKMELNERGLASEQINYQNIDGALEWINARNDCADFLIPRWRA
jgi:hypothetical protein